MLSAHHCLCLAPAHSRARTTDTSSYVLCTASTPALTQEHGSTRDHTPSLLGLSSNTPTHCHSTRFALILSSLCRCPRHPSPTSSCSSPVRYCTQSWSSSTSPPSPRPRLHHTLTGAPPSTPSLQPPPLPCWALLLPLANNSRLLASLSLVRPGPRRAPAGCSYPFSNRSHCWLTAASCSSPTAGRSPLVPGHRRMLLATVGSSKLQLAIDTPNKP
jgi:hypothetical protein